MMASQSDDRIASFRAFMRQFAIGNPATRPDALSGALQTEIAAERERIVAAHRSYARDSASADMLLQIGEVLATYLALSARGVSSEETLKAITEGLSVWVVDHAESYTEARLGISRDAPEQAFDQARANFKTRGEQRFGAQFRYEEEEAGDDRAFFAITRCMFNDVLRAAGHPEVIPVFCALDVLWAGEATHPRYNLEFLRPTTLAEGADRCRFQFRRRKDWAR